MPVRLHALPHAATASSSEPKNAISKDIPTTKSHKKPVALTALKRPIAQMACAKVPNNATAKNGATNNANSRTASAAMAPSKDTSSAMKAQITEKQVLHAPSTVCSSAAKMVSSKRAKNATTETKLTTTTAQITANALDVAITSFSHGSAKSVTTASMTALTMVADSDAPTCHQDAVTPSCRKTRAKNATAVPTSIRVPTDSALINANALLTAVTAPCNTNSNTVMTDKITAKKENAQQTA